VNAEDLQLTDDPLVRRKNHVSYRERPCECCGELAWMREGRKRGRFCSKACSKRGANNPHWAGDDAEYGGRHERVRAVRGSADHCIHRNSIGCTDPWFEWARIRGADPLDIFNYVPMCKACHSFYDRASRQGINHHLAELNDDIVFECRKRYYLGGETYKALAREFGVSRPAMCAAVSLDGNTWRHVPWPEGELRRPDNNARGSQHRDAKLTEEIVAEARARTASGEFMRALAREYGVHSTAMRNAIIGVTWTHVPMPEGVQ
jgi:hypothetical protein